MKSKIISLMCVGLTVASASGCNLEEIKERRARDKARDTAEINQDIEEDLESENAQRAKVDLRNRIRYLEAIAGDYEGEVVRRDTHLSGTEVRMHVILRLTPAGVPAPWTYERPLTTSEVLEQIHGLSLNVDAEEQRISSHAGVVFVCSQLGQMPEYSGGYIRFACTIGGGTRSYMIELDDDSLPAALSGPARSAAVTRALIDGSLERIEIMNMSIRSDLGARFSGTLRRTAAQ
ncbi:MAG: hypothetical protein IT285_01395 [Bdellovibrionales bacterium]|nr:hypothetical protein [Bdellovibrionales bacterium]